MDKNSPEIPFSEKLKLVLAKSESLWLLLFAAMPLVVGSALSLWALEEKEWLISLSFWGWIVLFFLLSVPLGLSLIPNTLAGLVGGYLIGMWALPGMMLSFFLAALLGYAMSRKMDSGLREEIYRIWPASETALRKMEGNSFYLVLTFRLLPVPPFAIGNLLLAWLRVPLSSFLLGSILGVFPRMALLVWIGSKAEDIIQMVKHPMQVKEVQWFTLGTMAIAILIFYLLFRKKADRN